jgi:hypothetical protein
MSKLVVATLMGIILLVLCVKFFCCRKTQSSSYETTDQPQDPDDTEKNELTRIHSGSNKPKNNDLNDFQPIFEKDSFEVSREDEEGQ